MTKIICLFNHKGGVSKTTTTFNLGWKMAEMGKKVIIADFDPQCNLTGMVMGYRGYDDLEDKIYSSNSEYGNIRDGLTPAFEAKPIPVEAVNCIPVNGNKNLYLMAGHIGLAEYETTLGIAQELSGSLTTFRNLPGSIHFLLSKTAEKLEADYIFVDMSPSLGSLNQNLMSICDYFIVPLHPDYFSNMALGSLSSALPRWRKWAETASQIKTLQEADYPFPKPHSVFAGAIVQKYRPRNAKPSTAFQRWIDKLMNGLKDKLIPSLNDAKMINSSFKEIIGHEPWEPILEMSDFNSLIALSQEHQVPVYALTQENISQQGAVWEQTKKSMEVFSSAFAECAKKIINITSV